MTWEEWIAANVAKAVAIAALVLLAVGLLFLRQCSAERTAKAETKLATGQASAAIQSGQDAANTIGNRMDADAQTDTITRTNADANRKAEGGNVVVAAPATNSGLAGLCRHAAYRSKPECVQYNHP